VSWGVTPMCRRRAGSRGSPPKSSTRPAVGRRNPTSRLIKVDFPAPFGPSRPTSSPARISTVTRSRASASPYRRVTSTARASGSATESSSVVVWRFEQPADGRGVVLEGESAAAGEADEGGGAAAGEGLGDLDVAGVLQLAQVHGEVAGGHPQDLLQAREAEPVTLGQRGERGDHPQPRLGVDDRIELRQLIAHRRRRWRNEMTTPSR